MLKGIDENGEMKNVKVTEDGAVVVSQENSGSQTPMPVDIQNESLIIGNTNTNPVPVNGTMTIENTSQNAVPISGTVNIDTASQSAIPVSGTVNVDSSVTTLSAGVLTLSSSAQTISVNKKVTEIAIANYSETANITMTIGAITYTIGSNIAVDIPINKTVTSISLTATESDTKVQYVIKGEE